MHHFLDRVYSPALIKRGCTLIFILVSGLRLGLAQSTILISDPGITYNDTDSVTVDVYGPATSSTCGIIRYSIDYSFSAAWEGSGNMESADECPNGGCFGDLSTPSLDGCDNCWDFLYVVFLADGVEVYSDVIGDAGTTDAEQSGTIAFDYCASGMAENVSMEVYTQTWAMAESVTLSDISIECIENLPSLSPFPNVCEADDPVSLPSTISDIAGTWSGISISGYSFDPSVGPGNYNLTFTPSTSTCYAPISTTISVEKATVNDIMETLCPGESLTVNGTLYDQDNLIGLDTIFNGAANGCDSIINVTVNFFPVDTNFLSQTLCKGSSLTVHGTIYDEGNPAGFEVIPGGAENGCDSLISIDLSFEDAVVNDIMETLCPGNSLMINGTLYDQDNLIGSDTIFNGAVNGCDSIINVTLDLLPSYSNYIDATICAGKLFEFNGDQLNTTGLYENNYVTVEGCDSTVILNLIVLPEIPENFDTTVLSFSSCQTIEGEGLYDLESLLSDIPAGYNGLFYSAQDTTALIVNPGAYYSEAGIVYLRFFSSEDCVSDFIPIELELEEGLLPPVNCAGTTCEGEIRVYTTPASSDCQPYIWEVNGLGEILNGGSPVDSFIVVQWHTAGEGALALSLGGCPDAGYCPATYRQVIPIIGDAIAITGPQVVCNGTLGNYSIPQFEGTAIQWSVSQGGQIIAGQGTPNILVQWESHDFGAQQSIEVTYENCLLGCSRSSFLDITLLQGLGVTGQPALCQGDTISFTMYDIGTGAPVPAMWFLKDSSNTVVNQWLAPASQLSTQLDFPPGGYELLGITTEGGAFCADTISKSIDIYPIPPSPLGIEEELKVCSGSHDVITVIPADESFDTRWAIYDGSGAIRYGNQINHEWGNEMPYSLEISHVSLDGQQCFSPPLIIELEEVPAAELFGTAIHCTGDTSVYWVDESHPDGDWEVSPADLATILYSSQDSIVLEWIKSGDVTVTYSSCDRMASMDVVVSGVDVIGLSPLDTLCPDEPVVIEFTQDFEAFNWYNTAGNLVSMSPSPDLDTGLYWLSVENEYGCTRDTFIGVFRHPSREVPIWDGEGDFCLQGFDTLFTDEGVNIIEYRWMRNGQPIGQNQPFLITDEEGTYSVEVKTIDGCLFNSGPKGFSCGPGYNCFAQGLDFKIDSIANCINFRAYTDFEETPISFNWSVRNLSTEINVFTSTQDTIFIELQEGEKWSIYLNAHFYNPAFPDSIQVKCKTKHIGHPIKADFEVDQACAEKPVLFKNTSSLPDGYSQNDISWSWNFDESQSQAGSTNTSPYYTYSHPDTFRVQLTAELAGCSSIKYKDIIVNPKSSASFELPSQECPGTPIALIADTILNEGHQTTYNWVQTGLMPRSFKNNPAVSTSLEPLDSAAITLYTLNQFGCRDTLVKIINAPDTLGGMIEVFPDLPACEGDTILLTSPEGGVTWLWNDGQETESISTAERQAYSVTVLDQFHCSYEFGAINTDFDELPFFPVRAILYDENGDIESYAYDSLTVCEGEDVYLETLSEPPFDIEWSNGNNNDQIEFSEDRGNQLQSGVHDIFITIGSPYSNCRDTVPIRIIVNAPPPAPELQSNTPGPLCEGTPYTLSVSNPLPGITYTWPNDSTGTSYTTSEADAYVVTAEDSLGCTSTGDTLRVHAAPNTGQVTSGCLTRCRPDTLCFPDLDGASNFAWYFNGEPYSADSLLVATESGTYQFYAENDIGCSSISEPLDLTLYDGVGTITGEVVLDLNENGIADAADSLLSGVAIDWSSPQWGNGADTTNENGFIILPFVPAGGYQLVLDESSLDFPVIEGTVTAYDTTVMGCDNDYSFTWLLTYSVCVNTIDTIQAVQCAEEPFVFNGFTYFSDTTLVSVAQTEAGCDSTVVAQVSFLPYPTLSLDTTLCEGDILEWAGNTYASAGSFTDTLIIPNACDTVLSINLSFNVPDTIFQELISCDGEAVLFEGTWIEPGDTVLISPNGFACDTLYEVTVSPATVPAITVTEQPTCTGQQTGQITVSVNGIDAPEYSIDSINFQSAPTFNELPVGFNPVYVRGSEGCVFSELFFIDTIPVLTAWTEAFAIDCPGDLVTIHPFYQITDSSWVDIIWEDGQSTPTIEVEEGGNYPVIVTNDCEYFDMEILVQSSAALEPAAITDPGTQLGCLDTLELSANLPDGTLGLWETDPASIITEPTLPSTLIIWEGIGAGWAVWSLSTEDCPSYSQDTLWILPPPIFAAADDQLQIPADSVQSGIDILTNDQLPASPFAVALADSTYASYLFLSNGQLTVVASNALPPYFEVPYEICLLDCPEICTEAIIQISIEQATDEPEIWNGITPNGDGLNETLVFDQLEDAPDEYPDNELIVFNRWGDIVFRAQPYQNDWGGTNQKGGDLPDGTYYYILRLNVGDGGIIKGDVTILR